MALVEAALHQLQRTAHLPYQLQLLLGRGAELCRVRPCRVRNHARLLGDHPHVLGKITAQFRDSALLFLDVPDVFVHATQKLGGMPLLLGDRALLLGRVALIICSFSRPFGRLSTHLRFDTGDVVRFSFVAVARGFIHGGTNGYRATAVPDEIRTRAATAWTRIIAVRLLT